MKISCKSLCSSIIFSLLLLSCGHLHAGMVYLALGDSVTFGIDPSTPASLVPSFADQGFVKPFADSLAALNGGFRPPVLNLGISGELSTSFFTGIVPPGWQTDPELNKNYTNLATPQNAQMIASINAIHAAGNSVGYANFLIGANDLSYLVGTPAFLNASSAEQQSMIASAFGTIQSNYLTVLGELHQLAPEAKLILPGYYNPFPADVDPTDHGFYDFLLGVFNPLVKADAAAFGATFVDIAPSFLGKELQLTNIGTGDLHPNQAGYALIAADLTQAVVPEPASVIMLGIGIVGLLGYGRLRRSVA